MYVVKVGEYYVEYADITYEMINDVKSNIWIGEIKLSKVIETHFNNKFIAEYIAKKINGEVMEVADE